MLTANEPIIDYFRINRTKAKIDSNSFFNQFNFFKNRLSSSLPIIKYTAQELALNVQKHLLPFFNDSVCKSFVSPIEIWLPLKSFKNVNTKVNPALCVICEDYQIGEIYQGIPGLIIEVASMNYSDEEMMKKHALYQETGIKEYWILEPEQKMVFVYSLVKDRYIGFEPFQGEETIVSPLFPDLVIRVNDIFVTKK